jgi:lipopolysaccharide assembly outer membrane protein LptD (OstA)
VKNIKYIIFFLIIIVLSLPVLSVAQISDSLKSGVSLSSDSLSVVTSLDSTKLDSVQSDSIDSEKKSAQLEGPIKYQADIVRVSRNENNIYLEGNAKVVYQNMTLEAAKILIDQDDHT